MTHAMGRHRWAAALVALALVAAGCGGDDDPQTAPDEPAAAVGAEPGTDPQPEPDRAPTTEPSEPSETPAVEDTPVELTASFRGVTAETVTLGVTVIDFETLNEQFALDLAFADFALSYDAVVDWYNSRGGVLGRSIELVTEYFLPVGATTSEAACLALTEDNEVFAVLGGFTGPGAEAVNDCIVGLHETVLVGPAPNAEQAASFGGLWVSPEMSLDRRNDAFVNLLAQSGQLDELGPIMVIGGDANAGPLVDNISAALRAAGADVRVETVMTTSGDTQATQAEVDVFVERARTDGVETVVLLGEAEDRNIHIFRTAPELTYLVPNGDRITDWQSIPPEGLGPETVVLSSTSDILPGDDAAYDDCVAAVSDRLGLEVRETSELAEGEPNYWSGTRNACQRVAMFVQIAEAAGPDLTQDSWLAALDQVPDLVVPGFAFVSLTSTKTDASDTLRLVRYDLESLMFEPLTDTLDVG